MPLPVGAGVVVRTFGNKRGVVVEADRNGRYRVRVENLTVWCREEDLEIPPEGRKKTRTARKDLEPRAASQPDIAPPSRVDLHGLRVEEAIARVVDEIDRALLRGADRVEVVHGKGAGRIKEALHRQLAAMPVVSSFTLDRRNPGVTWVYFT